MAIGLPEEAALEQAFDYYDAADLESYIEELPEKDIKTKLGL